jgi:glycosyltransferase involved in cell wall biosynthesis
MVETQALTPPPLVSVLMPAFNSEAYIKEAISSILSQTYPHFELIILDDGSSDSTFELIMQFQDPRIRALRHEKNQGTVATRNELVTLAKGKYIALLDNDDIARSDRLEAQVSFLEENPIDICGSDHLTLDEITGRIKKSKQCHTDADIRAMMTVASPLSHPSIMARASVLKNHPYEKNTDIAEDYALWLTLSLAGFHFANLKKNLITYRIHPKQFSQSQIEKVQILLQKYQINYLRGLGINPELIPRKLRWSLRLQIGPKFLLALNRKIPNVSFKANYQIYSRFQFRGNFLWTPLTRLERVFISIIATIVGKLATL